MSLQKDKNRKTPRNQRGRLTLRGLALAGAGAALATVMSAAPASAAFGSGITQIQGGTGVLGVKWDAQSPRYLNTISGNFISATGVGNPRLHVRVLDAQNREMFSRDRSWGGNRRDEVATFEVTVLMPRDASRVCATLYEGGGYMDTACSPVYF
ncbi:hypothetical protein EAO75_43475 [Streptomyces sp. uw30]|uniref:hypothetical protein n=1 Tax=Streptomyces sp. uw30 TaxID=1828179 RepID=UPI0011CE7AB1|nr:hypothetical protein [Streptomyces sp. uw30]TXS39749.1 hypothetical protein EAO75_43475 [Streptomyces sp. uw30]